MDPSYKALFNLDLAKLPSRNLLPRFNISNNMTTNPEDPPPRISLLSSMVIKTKLST